MAQEPITNPGNINSLTGDMVAAMRENAGRLVFDNPESVDAYALWSALFDLEQMFGEGEQGIPLSTARAIDAAVLDSTRALLQGGYLQRHEIPPTHIVQAVIVGLSVLRIKGVSGTAP